MSRDMKTRNIYNDLVEGLKYLKKQRKQLEQDLTKPTMLLLAVNDARVAGGAAGSLWAEEVVAKAFSQVRRKTISDILTAYPALQSIIFLQYEMSKHRSKSWPKKKNLRKNTRSR